MTVGFNVLHVVLLVCALFCVHFTLGEVRHRPLTRPRLWAPPLLSLACALIFLLIHLGTRQSPWTVAVAAGAGLAIGLLRGFTLAIEVDHQIDKVRLPRARGSLVLALLLLAAVLLAIVGAFVGTVHTLYREYSPEVAAACAGIFFGRATAIFLRWQRAPYVDLHRT